MLKTNLEIHTPKEFRGCFESNTYCVMVLGWLKQEKTNNSDFESFQVGHLKTVSRHYTVTVDWAGAAYISCYKCL